MATFLVKRIKSVDLVVPMATGFGTIKRAVTPHANAGRITLSDAHAKLIHPKHAKHMIRLDKPGAPAPASKPALESATEEPTRPDLPSSVRGRRSEKITG